MKDALTEVGTGFLAFSIFGAFFNAALRDIFGVEVAASADSIRQAKYPAKLADRFAR